MEGEGSTLEFKVQVPSAKKIARTLCAFANTRGGRIIVGVMDNGEIVGVVDVEKEKMLLQEAARFYCEPAIPLTFKVYEEHFLPVLVARIKASKHKPHAVFQNEDTTKVYIRVQDKTMPASKLVTKTLANEEADAPQRSLNSKEQGIMGYVAKRESVTIKDVSIKFNLSKRRARRMLVALTQEGFLREHATSKEDFYTLS